MAISLLLHDIETSFKVGVASNPSVSSVNLSQSFPSFLTLAAPTQSNLPQKLMEPRLPNEERCDSGECLTGKYCFPFRQVKVLRGGVGWWSHES
jgi:hypothetical protein